ENLSECRDLLTYFGGHPMAAGMTLLQKNIHELRLRINHLAADVLTESDFHRTIKIDFTCSVNDITPELIGDMEKLAPFGAANPPPKVMIKDEPLMTLKQIGSDKSHLKALFAGEKGRLEGIGFHLGHLYDDIAKNAQ